MNYKDDIKAVVFDYDGTLVDYKTGASEYTKFSLKKLKENGYKVCLSSGRPCFLAKKAFEDTFGLNILDYIFGCNGAEVQDMSSGNIEILDSVSAKDVRRLGRLFKDCDFLTLLIYDDPRFLLNRLDISDELMSWLDARYLKPTYFDYDTNTLDRSKVLVLNNSADRQKEDEYLKNIDLSDFSVFYSSPVCLEISPKGVNKAKTIDLLAKKLGCSNRQILSFGDMQNDLPMLENSTGVAMGNATDDVKARIKLRTDDVDKLGIYSFLHENKLI